MQPQRVEKGTHADGVHAGSWETCVILGTCNLTQELNRHGGLSSIFFVGCLNYGSLGTNFVLIFLSRNPEKKNWNLTGVFL
jgi:hypothetical protein